MDGTVEPLRILLVDDHNVVRQGLRLMLERQRHFSVVGEASDGYEAMALASELMPDIILMDVRMPGCSGLTALTEIRKNLPSISVVMLTVSEDDEDLFTAVKAGARGYLLKTADAGELVRAVEQVARGGAVVSPLMAMKLLNEYAAIEVDRRSDDLEGAEPQLTVREKEILDLLAQGRLNKEIATTLCVAESTVKSHLRNVMDKLQIHNRAQAAAYATRRQFLSKRRPEKT